MSWRRWRQEEEEEEIQEVVNKNFLETKDDGCRMPSFTTKQLFTTQDAFDFDNYLSLQ